MTDLTHKPPKTIMCRRHNVPMYLRTKGDTWWYSHKHYYQEDKFFWCNGRIPFDWQKFYQEKRCSGC